MKVLHVDDSPLVIKLGEKELVENGFEPLVAYNGEEALSVLEKNEVDLVVLDYHMPKLNGLQTLHRIRQHSDSRKANVPVLILSDENNPDIISVLLEAGASDYVHKEWLTRKPGVFIEKVFELLKFEAKLRFCRHKKLEQTLSPIVKSFHGFVRLYFQPGLSGKEITLEEIQRELRDVYGNYCKGEFFEIIYDIVETEDYLTAHSVNATLLTMMFAKFLGFEEEKVLDMMLGALFHDFGNAGIDSPIHRNPTGLSDDEFSLYMRHVERGVSIAEILGLPPRAIDFISNHHERMDGSGFPWHKDAGNLSDIAQIALIVDSFDSLTFKLDGQKRLMVFEALRKMKSWEGQYSDEFLKRFEEFLDEKKIKPDA